MSEQPLHVEYGCTEHDDDHLDCCCSERCLWRIKRYVTRWMWAHPAQSTSDPPPHGWTGDRDTKDGRGQRGEGDQ